MVAPNPSRLPSKQPDDGAGWTVVDVSGRKIVRVIANFIENNTRLEMSFVSSRRGSQGGLDAFTFRARRFTWEDGAVRELVRGNDGSIDTLLVPGARLDTRPVPGDTNLFDVRLLAPAATP